MDLPGRKIWHTVRIKQLITDCRPEEQRGVSQHNRLAVTNDTVGYCIQSSLEICRKSPLGKHVGTIIIVNPRGITGGRRPCIALIAYPILPRLRCSRFSLCNQISRSTAVQRVGCGCRKLNEINIAKLHKVNIFLRFCKA